MSPQLAHHLPGAAVRVRPGDGEEPPPGVGPVELPLQTIECHRPGPRQVRSHHGHEGSRPGVGAECLNTRMSSVGIGKVYCPEQIILLYINNTNIISFKENSDYLEHGSIVIPDGDSFDDEMYFSSFDG